MVYVIDLTALTYLAAMVVLKYVPVQIGLGPRRGVPIAVSTLGILAPVEF